MTYDTIAPSPTDESVLTIAKRLHALDFPVGKGLIHEGMQAPIDDSPGGLAFTTRKPVLVNARDLERSFRIIC